MPGATPAGIALDPEQEVEADEHALEGRLHAAVEAAPGAPGIVEPEQRVEVLVAGPDAVGAAGERASGSAARRRARRAIARDGT